MDSEHAYGEASILDKLRLDIHSMGDVNPKAGSVCSWDTDAYDTCASCTNSYMCAPRTLNNIRVLCDELGVENLAELLLSHDKEKGTVFKMLARVVPEDPVTGLNDIAGDLYTHCSKSGLEPAKVYLKHMTDFLEGKMVHLREADRLNAEADMWKAKAEEHDSKAEIIGEVLELFDGSEGDKKYRGN